MQNQNLCTIGHTWISLTAVPRGRGSLIPNVAHDNLVLSYNNQLRCQDITVTSETFDLSNIKAYRIQDEIHINGYINISADISANTTLVTIGTESDQAYDISYCYMKQSDKMHIGRVRRRENTLQNIGSINVADGAYIYIDLSFRARWV